MSSESFLNLQVQSLVKLSLQLSLLFSELLVNEVLSLLMVLCLKLLSHLRDGKLRRVIIINLLRFL